MYVRSSHTNKWVRRLLRRKRSAFGYWFALYRAHAVHKTIQVLHKILRHLSSRESFMFLSRNMCAFQSWGERERGPGTLRRQRREDTGPQTRGAQ